VTRCDTGADQVPATLGSSACLKIQAPPLPRPSLAETLSPPPAHADGSALPSHGLSLAGRVPDLRLLAPGHWNRQPFTRAASPISLQHPGASPAYPPPPHRRLQWGKRRSRTRGSRERRNRDRQRTQAGRAGRWGSSK
jgi:hypothetical protein